ncbi:MAG: hypothetical protein M3P18_11920, partial [Actinomycetota bacterium]|nr:hypothetical protein [Actinomycetota bacterium]
HTARWITSLARTRRLGGRMGKARIEMRDVVAGTWHRRRLALVLFGGFLLLVLPALPASAQAGADQAGPDNQIVLDGQLVIPQGETVKAAVVFNGPADVAGTVTDSLVVFNGRATISGTVQGDVVVFHGQVSVASGGVVRGKLVSQSTPTIASGALVSSQQRLSTIDWGKVGLVSRIAWWFGYSVSVLILGLLLLLFAPRLDEALLAAWHTRRGASIGLGVAAFFLLPIAALLLLVIVIAVPLGLFLLLALALLYTLGYVAATHLIGRLVLKPPRSRYAAFLVGWVILRVLALIPIVGGLVWVLASILGLGLLFVAGRRGATVEVVSPMPPVPPVSA